MSWLKNAWKSVKKATKSPIFHVVEGGLALAFPEVAIPAAAALTMGNKALDMANSTNAAVRSKYRTVIANTEKLAKSGHPGAVRAMQAMTLAKDAKLGNPKALAEVAAIRAHGATFRAAGQAIAKHYQMHPRTGIVSIKPQHVRH